MNILAQFFGALALLILIISYQQTVRKRFLFLQIFSNAFYSLQYLVLNAHTAMLTCIVSVFKTLIFYNSNKNDKDTSVLTLISLEIIYIIIGVFTYTSLYSLIPIVIACIYTYGTWQKELKITYIIGFISSVLWVIYNIIVGAYVSVISNFFELFASLIGFVRIFKVTNKDN